jgi:hypothetical protein
VIISAAVTIQKVWKGYTTRKVLQNYINYLMQNEHDPYESSGEWDSNKYLEE